MSRKLEEEFNLPHLDEMEADGIAGFDIQNNQDTGQYIQSIEDALTISEKINSALAEVKGMEGHDGEMDEIATEAVDAYKQLMNLGMNMTDMAAGPVFGNAAQMLKIALDARDSKVNRKLKQIDLMLKKARLDQTDKKNQPQEEEEVTAKTFDRNDLLKMLNDTKPNS